MKAPLARGQHPRCHHRWLPLWDRPGPAIPGGGGPLPRHRRCALPSCPHPA